MEDLVPGGGVEAGGPSLYAARAAAALGARVTLVSRVPGGFDRAVFDGLELAPLPATLAPRYANLYDARGNRTQKLAGEGEPLDTDGLGLRSADAVIAAPAFHELAGFPCVAAPVRSVSLQGPLRATTHDGAVVPHEDPWRQAEPFLAPGAFAFLSDEDTADAPALARRLAAGGMTVFVTRGSDGATRYDAGGERRFDEYPARPVDPTGAGDCFATAFTVRLAEGAALDDATCFALAAAAVSTEGRGVFAVPTRAMVEARLREAS